MKSKIPRCPICTSLNSVAKVKSYNENNGEGMLAFFCSNCLTEFDEENRILRPLWVG